VRVTVVVTTRDRPRLLEDALASIESQTVAPLEVRLADAGTVPVALAPRPGLTIIDAGGLRASQARNRAAGAAAGDVLAFLDDDDRWLPEHLAGLVAAMEAGAAFAFRDSVIVRERVGMNGAREDQSRRVIARAWDDALMRTDDFVPPSAWGVRRSLFDELGGFDPSFRFSDDWDFLLRARGLTTPERAPGVTVEIRMREEGNASADFGPERLADLRLLEARHGLPPLVPKTFWEVAETVA
jgi:glycosyltransferase involved in cell wall biosynthesis